MLKLVKAFSMKFANLAVNICGIQSPNPFWLASAPPTNTADQIMRAFDAGWGGAVWKTIDVPIVNVQSRLAVNRDQRNNLIGLTNIEMCSDRPIDMNVREIAEVKKRQPKNVIIASIMMGKKEEYRDIISKCEDAGADGLEMNFSCPHGHCEKGMGSAIGQEPKVMKEIMAWVKEYAKVPVFVKLTPNITDILEPAEAAVSSGADALSLINTIKSINHVNLNSLLGEPIVGGKFTNGGYAGPAVKPIALHMIAQIGRSQKIGGIPISGIGGISCWEDAVEFLALGATTLQVCTAVMLKGQGIIKPMLEGLSKFLDSKNMTSISDLIGIALPHYSTHSDLDRNQKVVAEIDKSKCNGCNACYISCLDGGHQAIHTTVGNCKAYHGPSPYKKLLDQPLRLKEEKQVKHKKQPGSKFNIPFINKDECVGCNLCSLVCPQKAIKMKQIK